MRSNPADLCPSNQINLTWTMLSQTNVVSSFIGFVKPAEIWISRRAREAWKLPRSRSAVSLCVSAAASNQHWSIPLCAAFIVRASFVLTRLARGGVWICVGTQRGPVSRLKIAHPRMRTGGFPTLEIHSSVFSCLSVLDRLWNVLYVISCQCARVEYTSTKTFLFWYELTHQVCKHCFYSWLWSRTTAAEPDTRLEADAAELWYMLSLWAPLITGGLLA